LRKRADKQVTDSNVYRTLRNSYYRMTEENPILLAPSDKIEPTNVIGRKFSVKFQISTDWLLLAHNAEFFFIVSIAVLALFAETLYE
jgi:hypothetical protein